MANICFHWSPPVSIAENDKAARKLLKHWTHTAKCLGVTSVFCIGDPPSINDGGINFTVIGSLDDLGGELVYVEQGGVMLAEFEHPEECTYVFGSDYGGLPRADLSIDCGMGLYAEQACAIVLHDRMVKS
jgi:hypothetical protein